MKKAQVTAGVLFLVLLVVLACTPKSAPGVVPEAAVITTTLIPTPQVASAPAREKWEEEWDLLVRAAQKEGRVVVYHSQGGEPARVLTDFGTIYGIRVEVMAARGEQISQKLQTERRAGIYAADVYNGGATTLVTMLKPAGMLDPLEPTLVLPEVIDPKVWWKGQLDWVDAERKILAFAAYPTPPLAINTELVKPGEIKSYRDLLNPKWKGKMLMDDPTIGGGGSKLSVVGEYTMGWDYLRELAKQEPVITRDRRLLVEWVARAKYAISIQPSSPMVTEFASAGAPLALLTPMEGTYLTSGSSNVALINRAPHPNAARLFINWLLTREGGLVVSKATGYQSSRVDVPIDHLDPLKIRQPGMKYVITYDEEYALKEPEYMKQLKEIFGHLIK